MRILLLLSVALLAPFLSSCSATQNLSVFSINNTDIENILQKELPQLTQKLKVMGLPVDFAVDDLSVNIGPDNRDVVQLSIGSTANIKALMLNYPVSLQLKVEGTPYFDSDSQAIFLKNVALLDSSIDAGGFSGNLGLLDKEAMALVNRFLARNPIHKLDPNNTTVQLISRLGLNMKIEEGKIRIVPGN